MMYLAYIGAPSHFTRGPVRHTRPSLIDPGPWLSQDDPALYYYLLNLEEGRVSASFRHPGNPDTILWDGFPREGLPEQPSEIPEAYRYIPPAGASSAMRGRDQDRSVINGPRRYGNRP